MGLKPLCFFSFSPSPKTLFFHSECFRLFEKEERGERKKKFEDSSFFLVV